MPDNLQIQNLQETVEKCNTVIRDVYDAVVGDVKGKVGLIAQVMDMQGRIRVIEDKMHKFEEGASKIANVSEDLKSIAQLKEDLKDLKIKSAGIEKIINDRISPEVEDTKKKKWWFGGIISCIIFLWAILKFVVPLIIDLAKKGKIP
jgi:hypothetical protein